MLCIGAGIGVSPYTQAASTPIHPFLSRLCYNRMSETFSLIKGSQFAKENTDLPVGFFAHESSDSLLGAAIVAPGLERHVGYEGLPAQSSDLCGDLCL